MQTRRIHDLRELEKLAEDLLDKVPESTSALVVSLSGELGAGKTTFVQAVARSFGITETVHSPTFVIEKIYTLPEGPFGKLVHIDAYRLKEERELEVLGWSELVSNPTNLIFIEWPEKVPGLIPSGAIKVRFDIDGDARIISIDGGQESTEKDN